MQTNKTLNIWFNKSRLTIYLYNNPVANLIHTKFKHLATLPIQLFESDVYFNDEVVNFNLAVDKLINYAKELNINIETPLLHDQSYLNYLHRLYEENFNGLVVWLKFHECIHILEKILYKRSQPIISIDYRTKAGKLEEKFDRKFFEYADDKVTKNQCFVQWQELAKTPYQYFANQEPNDITRLCQLAKPWLTLKPSLHFACDKINFLDNIDLNIFDNWFADYKEQWCTFWNIPDWNSKEPFLVVPIGELESSDLLIDNLKNNQFPLRVTQ